jgi:hypothetical protein
VCGRSTTTAAEAAAEHLERLAEPAPERPERRAEAAPRPPRPAGTATPGGGTDDGRRTIVIGEPRDADEDQPAARSAVDRRRTIVIGARAAQPAARRRPPRTTVERIGPRPDRIVAYAVALGVLLILIAVLSAGH